MGTLLRDAVLPHSAVLLHGAVLLHAAALGVLHVPSAVLHFTDEPNPLSPPALLLQARIPGYNGLSQTSFSEYDRTCGDKYRE